MAAQTPTFEPDRITAGDSATWKRSLPDYKAGDGWALTYAFVKQDGGGSQAITFAATPSGDDFLVNVPAATTAPWPPGDYVGQGYVTLTPDRFKIWDGFLRILPNLALAPAGVGDIRSHARRTLDAIQSVLEGRATQEILEWTVEGVVLRKASVTDLLLLEDRYLVKVQKEEALARIRAGKATGRRILTKFIRPGLQTNSWPPGFVRS